MFTFRVNGSGVLVLFKIINCFIDAATLENNLILHVCVYVYMYACMYACTTSIRLCYYN